MLHSLRRCKDLKKMLDVFISNLKPDGNEEQCYSITKFLMLSFKEDYFSGQEFLMYHSSLRFDDIAIVISYWKFLLGKEDPLK